MQTMTMLKAALAAGLAVAACGDSGGSGGDASNTTGGGGNTTGGGGGDTTGGGTGCAQNGTGGTSNCTKQEQDDYTNCLTSACDTENKKCFGNDYKMGTYAGVCGTFQKCVVDCDCSITCVQACGTPPSDCLSCYQELSACTTKACPPPDCLGGTGGINLGDGGLPGAGHTCAELKSCCDSMAAGQSKDTCDQIYAGVMPSGDQVCGAAWANLGCK